jgi:predicted ATPase
MMRRHDGVWFVDLAPLVESALVSSAIANVLGIADEGGSRQLIERVIAAAAEAADHLLRGCPGIFILLTSREPLGIAGEEPFCLPSLPVPPEGAEMTAERCCNFGAAARLPMKTRRAWPTSSGVSTA